MLRLYTKFKIGNYNVISADAITKLTEKRNFSLQTCCYFTAVTNIVRISKVHCQG